MYKRIFILLFLISAFFVTPVHSTLVNVYFDYEGNSDVTADNLNGNRDNIINVINGNLDNSNIGSGYRLFELLGSVPAAGTQGRIVFDTTNNDLNFDTGSAWYKVIGFSGTPVQGDIIYHDGTKWVNLAASTSGYILKTQGAGANPAWSNSVAALTVAGLINSALTASKPVFTDGSKVLTSSGTLAIDQGGTGQTSAQAAIDALLPSQSGKSGYYLTTNATNSSWGANPTLSNVIFCWFGSDSAATNSYGMVEGTSLTPSMSSYTINYHFFGSDSDTVATLWTAPFVKIAGINTVTIHAKLWANSTNADSEAFLKVDIGGVNNTVKSVTSSTPTWVTTSTLNVSGLTNGTLYTITVQLYGEKSGAISAYCNGVVLTGS